ncbi:hypothetical protein SDC9_192346 [bioreactor metagenome]|uniref:Uncharacterized protein n=1 Tax=bioreactor metagenome TaxID=1076179 RepID=A0A645I0G5_9ZZZZ
MSPSLPMTILDGSSLFGPLIVSGTVSIVTSTVIESVSFSETGLNLGSLLAADTAEAIMASPWGSTGSGYPMHPLSLPSGYVFSVTNTPFGDSIPAGISSFDMALPAASASTALLASLTATSPFMMTRFRPSKVSSSQRSSGHRSSSSELLPHCPASQRSLSSGKRVRCSRKQPSSSNSSPLPPRRSFPASPLPIPWWS